MYHFNCPIRVPTFRAWTRQFVEMLAIFVFACIARAAAAEPVVLDFDSAVKLCREYLAADDDDEREKALARLAGYTGDVEPVIKALSTRTYRVVKAGYYEEEPFQSEELRKKYPKDLLYFIVPKNYDAARPTGLIVFMHGGGSSTSRDAPMYTMRSPTSDSSSSRSGDMLAATGMITVGPSAPGKGESYYRWCLKASEKYLADVIAECKGRYNVDPDRVFLLGHSMGGFGAYHHAQRQPDRFAAIIVSSGAWDCGYWPVIRGTPLCIVQGVHDAQRGVRWHHTDVEYARWTHRIFTRESLEHVYYEHDGEHGIADNRAKIAEYFASAAKVRRDPYYPHVTLASPQGFASNYLHPVYHNRWITLNEAAVGKLEFDELATHGEDFDEWRLEHRRTSRRGSMIDAINRGNNRIDLSTENVERLTVWLHPKMVDISQPVTICVDGKVRFASRVKPSLKTVMESYERRRDWGMIYPMKVELYLNE
jgi:pimeloyl-ACP methyl ester carboxylesterase